MVSDLKPRRWYTLVQRLVAITLCFSFLQTTVNGIRSRNRHRLLDPSREVRLLPPKARVTPQRRDDEAQIDSIILDICENSDILICQTTSNGYVRSASGTYGKILFAKLVNKDIDVYRSCTRRRRYEKMADPPLSCSPEAHVSSEKEPFISIVLKFPFVNTMKLHEKVDSRRLDDNRWLREMRSTRSMGNKGLGPHVIDVVRVPIDPRSGLVKPIGTPPFELDPRIPNFCLVMEEVNGSTVKYISKELISEIESTVILAFENENSSQQMIYEAWNRLRLFIRVQQLYLRRIQLMWKMDIRHCDIHSGNILLERTDMKTMRDKDLAYGISSGQAYIRTPKSSEFVMHTTEEVTIPDDAMVYWLAEDNLKILDWSYAVQISARIRAFKGDKSKLTTPCHRFSDRNEDMYEVNRSMEDVYVKYKEMVKGLKRMNGFRSASTPRRNWKGKQVKTTGDMMKLLTDILLMLEDAKGDEAWVDCLEWFAKVKKEFKVYHRSLKHRNGDLPAKLKSFYLHFQKKMKSKYDCAVDSEEDALSDFQNQLESMADLVDDVRPNIAAVVETSSLAGSSPTSAEPPSRRSRHSGRRKRKS